MQQPTKSPGSIQKDGAPYGVGYRIERRIYYFVLLICISIPLCIWILFTYYNNPQVDLLLMEYLYVYIVHTYICLFVYRSSQSLDQAENMEKEDKKCSWKASPPCFFGSLHKDDSDDNENNTADHNNATDNRKQCC